MQSDSENDTNAQDINFNIPMNVKVKDKDDDKLNDDLLYSNPKVPECSNGV